MPNKFLLFACTVFFASGAFSQTYTVKKNFTDAEKKQFLGKTKEFFNLDPQITYNLSSNDAAASFAAIQDAIKYDEAYLKKQKLALAKDSTNAMALNNIGNYYSYLGNTAEAKAHFRKSLQRLSVKATQKDSAFYYSFRAILKSNLEMEGAILDIEKALRINPNDSTATTFYPMFLIQKGQIADAKKVCRNALDAKKGSPELPYLYFIVASLFEKYEFAFTGNDEAAKKQLYRKTDYDQIVDYAEIDQYTKRYPDNQKIQNLRKLSEILSLMMKIYVFERNDDNWFTPAFMPGEVAKMAVLEKWLETAMEKGTLNKYAGYKSIGFINFLLEKRAKSIDYYQKAIAIFPASKATSQFNDSECRDLLVSLYRLQKDNAGVRKTIESKLATIEGQKSAFDHLLMSKFLLQENKTEEAMTWAKKAKEISPKNFETLRLLSHLYFLDERQSMSKFLAEEASAAINNNTDYYNLDMQFAIYHILNGDAMAAMENIRLGRELRTKDKEPCPLCDELIANYIIAK